MQLLCIYQRHDIELKKQTLLHLTPETCSVSADSTVFSPDTRTGEQMLLLKLSLRYLLQRLAHTVLSSLIKTLPATCFPLN